jgi:hypothetical protein
MESVIEIITFYLIRLQSMCNDTFFRLVCMSSLMTISVLEMTTLLYGNRLACLLSCLYILNVSIKFNHFHTWKTFP